MLLLVYEARDNDPSGNRVQETEHTDPNNEACHLVCLSAAVLDYGAHSEQADEANEEEDCAQDEVKEQRGEYKPTHCGHVPQTHVAGASQHIP